MTWQKYSASYRFVQLDVHFLPNLDHSNGMYTPRADNQSRLRISGLRSTVPRFETELARNTTRAFQTFCSIKFFRNTKSVFRAKIWQNKAFDNTTPARSEQSQRFHRNISVENYYFSCSHQLPLTTLLSPWIALRQTVAWEYGIRQPRLIVRARTIRKV